MDREALAEACKSVPLFPLPGVVLFPHTVLPLHVFEARYRDLVRDCIQGNGILAVPLLAPGWEADYDGRPPVHPVSGVGRIVHSQKLADGRYNIAVLGLGRMRIGGEHPPEQSYRLARATLLDEVMPEGGAAALSPVLAQIKVLLAQLLTIYPRLQDELGRVVAARSLSAQVVDGLAHLLIHEPADRQAYIEEDHVMRRAEQVLEELAAAIARASSSSDVEA